MRDVTGKNPKMWGDSIVGYDSYNYKYSSGQEGSWPICGYSPRAQNISIYIMAGFSKFEEQMKKLGKYKTGRSCLYIKKLEDIDWSVLEELAQRSYEYMTNKYG